MAIEMIATTINTADNRVNTELNPTWLTSRPITNGAGLLRRIMVVVYVPIREACASDDHRLAKYELRSG